MERTKLCIKYITELKFLNNLLYLNLIFMLSDNKKMHCAKKGIMKNIEPSPFILLLFNLA